MQNACINHQQEHIFSPKVLGLYSWARSFSFFNPSPLSLWQSAQRGHKNFSSFSFLRETIWALATATGGDARLPLRARETAQSLLVAENEGDNFLFSPWLPNGLGKTKGRMHATSQEKDSFLSDMITKGVINLASRARGPFFLFLRNGNGVACCFFKKVKQRGAAGTLFHKKSSFCSFI